MTGRLGPWLRGFVAVALLVALIVRLGGQAFLDGFRSVGVAQLLAALGIGLVTTLCSAARWCIVARRLGLRLPLGTAVGDYYRASLLNAALPAGVLGDVHRAISHGRAEGDLGRGVRAVFLERAAGQLVVIAASVGMLLAWPHLLRSLAAELTPSVAALAVAGCVLLALAATVLSRRVRRALARTARDLRTGLAPRAWPGIAVLSAAAFAGHLALFVVAARSAGATAPVTGLLPLLVVALLVMGLPVNVGGWGPREAAAALAFGVAGLGAALGVATSVVYGVLALTASLPGLGVLLARRLRRPAPANAVSSRPGPASGTCPSPSWGPDRCGRFRVPGRAR